MSLYLLPTSLHILCQCPASDPYVDELSLSESANIDKWNHKQASYWLQNQYVKYQRSWFMRRWRLATEWIIIPFHQLTKQLLPLEDDPESLLELLELLELLALSTGLPPSALVEGALVCISPTHKQRDKRYDIYFPCMSISNNNSHRK